MKFDVPPKRNIVDTGPVGQCPDRTDNFKPLIKDPFHDKRLDKVSL